jgi:hypothetical protein
MGDLLTEEKRFYERFWALHNDPVLLSICKRFGISTFRRSSVLEGFDGFLIDNQFRGKRCIEIGTCNGLTAVILSRYFEEVVSIDIAPNDLKHRVLAHCGIQNVIFRDVYDNAAKAKIIRGLTFDSAFIDGNHAEDTETDFALVQHCKRVLLHEYWAEQPAVVDLVSRLSRQGVVVTSGKWALWTNS